jgi:hypothetical protein
MKTYKIAYATYPFDVMNFTPEFEKVEAKNLTEAIETVRKKYGSSIEIFEQQARKHYNEY